MGLGPARARPVLSPAPGPAWARAPVGCDLPCARTHVCFPCLCLTRATAKRVALSFLGGSCQVRPALRKVGRAYSLGGQITYPFDAVRLRFGGERVSMAQNGLRCDLPCARRVAPNIRHVLAGATCLAQSGWHQIWGHVSAGATRRTIYILYRNKSLSLSRYI